MNNTNEEFRSQDSTQLSKKYVVQTWLPQFITPLIYTLGKRLIHRVKTVLQNRKI